MRRARRQRRTWICWLPALLVVGAAAAATAQEQEPTAPSVCAPPCPEGQTCVGQSCVTPDLRPPAPKPRGIEAPPATPPAPAGSAPPSGPQPPSDPGPSPPAAPPAPAYLPPPGYPSAPPPDYAYAPPPGYAYPPPPPQSVYAPALKPPRTKRRFLLLPHLGMHSFQNSGMTTYDPGLRIGMLIGTRIGDLFSLDADVTVDRNRTHGVAPGADLSEWSFVLAVGPLLQLRVGRLELVVGPKAGYFQMRSTGRSPSFPSDTMVERRLTGFTLGMSSGIFVPVTASTSLGLLISYELRSARDACQKTSGQGRTLPEACNPSGDSDQVLGLSGGVLF